MYIIYKKNLADNKFVSVYKPKLHIYSDEFKFPISVN